jgi:hypothetical protein
VKKDWLKDRVQVIENDLLEEEEGILEHVYLERELNCKQIHSE